MDEIIQLLNEVKNNCGDIRGCDGEYIDVQINNIINLMSSNRIISAAEMRLLKLKKINKKEIKTNLRKVAIYFIENVVYPEMLERDDGNNCVNIALPDKAYEDIDAFVSICKDILPKDYKVSRSGDGAGMYDTLFVSWAK
jgi:hypothetical protein